jgi:hypothetical protein
VQADTYLTHDGIREDLLKLIKANQDPLHTKAARLSQETCLCFRHERIGLWRTGDKGAVTAALAGLASVVGHSIGDERIVACYPRDPGVTLRHPRGILGQDHVDLFPPSGCQSNVSKRCGHLAGVSRMVKKKLEQIEIPYLIAPPSVIKYIWPGRVPVKLHNVTSERDLALNEPGEFFCMSLWPTEEKDESIHGTNPLLRCRRKWHSYINPPG